MSGHSKWATTKRAKAIVDAKRGAAFTKVANLITIAARNGADPETNFQLRLAIDKGRAVNMPKDNIERAVKRGAGIAGEAALEELVYEAIGPAQTQFIVKCLTNSRNRTAAVIRHAFDKFGGSMSAVMWNFELKGIIFIAQEKLAGVDWDNLEMELIDAGADDIINDEDGVTIYCSTSVLQTLKATIEKAKIEIESAGMEFVAKDKIELSDAEHERVAKLTDALDEIEDVADYYTNIK